MPIKPDRIQADSITLEKIRFAMQDIISPALLADMAYESIEELQTDSVIKKLTFYLFANKVHAEEYEVEVRVYPSTMWEELKQDFWPRWLKRRFPPRYSKDITLHTHTYFHVCPHLNTKSDRQHLDFMKLNDIDL
jgi:hypothetical protein